MTGLDVSIRAENAADASELLAVEALVRDAFRRSSSRPERSPLRRASGTTTRRSSPRPKLLEAEESKFPPRAKHAGTAPQKRFAEMLAQWEAEESEAQPNA